jgi:hypothetical protein
MDSDLLKISLPSGMVKCVTKLFESPLSIVKPAIPLKLSKLRVMKIMSKPSL